MVKKSKTPRSKVKKAVKPRAKRPSPRKSPQSKSNTVKSINAAEVKLTKALDTLKSFTTKVEAARGKAKEAALKAKQNGKAASINASKRANETVNTLMAKRKDAASKVKLARETVRAAKQKLRREEQEKRLKERKEVAKQKALATFLKKWEHEWDRKTKSQGKNKRKSKVAAA